MTNKNHIFMPFTERTYRVIIDMIYPVAFKESDDGYVFLKSKIRALLSNYHDFKENE